MTYWARQLTIVNTNFRIFRICFLEDFLNHVIIYNHHFKSSFIPVRVVVCFLKWCSKTQKWIRSSVKSRERHLEQDLCIHIFKSSSLGMILNWIVLCSDTKQNKIFGQFRVAMWPNLECRSETWVLRGNKLSTERVKYFVVKRNIADLIDLINMIWLHQ